MGKNKVGLDYFSFDTSLEYKMRLIEAEFGLIGFGVVVKLWQRIYAERGYYVEFDEEVALLFADEIKVGGNVVSEIVRAAIKRGVFHQGMYENYKILTSHGIQKRYVEGTIRRVRVEMEERYLLLSIPEIPVNVYINGVNVCNNPENVYTNAQSKVKESKVEKSKVEESRDTPAAANVFRHYEFCFGIMPPTAMQEIDGYLAEGIEPEMIVAVFDEAVAQGKANWRYAKAILESKRTAGIKTLAGFRRSQADFRKSKEKSKKLPKRSSINNYEDTNHIDFAALEEQLLDRMIEGGDDDHTCN